MRVTWLDKVRAMSLDHLYMVDDWPETEPPPHLLWQSPFVFAKAEDLAARVRRAGELWLVNQDLRPYAELVIARLDRPWFMAFQRAARPDEGHLLIGPIERTVLRSGDGLPLWDLPLHYRESERASSRELWRNLGH